MLAMKPLDARVSMRVKMQKHHRIEERRGLVGKVVGKYSGNVYIVVGVRFPDGWHRLFSPGDLEEISSLFLVSFTDRQVLVAGDE
jgi:hypothetical protein